MNLPGINFYLGEDIDALRDAVKAFCDEEIAPRAAQLDRDDQFPMDLWVKMGALGVHGLTVPESLNVGGTGMGYIAHMVVMEEISRASASVGLSYGAHSNLCVNQLKRNGTDEQRRRFAKAQALLPKARHSFANSSGIFLGDGFTFDLTRPGIALYGGNPLPGQPNPMKPVAKLEAREIGRAHV